MALQQVDITSGQVSGVDDMGAAASQVINWETDEAGVLKPRPGLATYATTGTPSSAVIGMVRWKNYLVAVTADRYVSVIADGNPGVFQVQSTSSTATQLPGMMRPTFVIGQNAVYMAGGGQILAWAPGAAPYALSSSPAQVTHIATLGQRLIANDLTQPSKWFWSDAGEPAWGTWPAENTTSAESRPDPIVALAENTNELFVWGTETTQVYANGTDPTLPFDSIAPTNVGFVAPYAYARLDSAFAWLDGDRRIVIGDGRSANPISTAIQRDLRRLTTVSDAWMYREERGQQSLLVVRFPTERRTFAWDLKGEKWLGERAYYSAPFNTADWPVSAYVYWPPYRYHMFGSTTSGLLRFDEDSRQDIGGPLVCERTTGWHDFGTRNVKRAGRLRVTMRRGLAAQGATPGALEVRVQDDDKGWTSWKQLSVGVPEDYKQTADTWSTAGLFRRRRYGVRFSTTENVSLSSVHDDVDSLEAA